MRIQQREQKVKVAAAIPVMTFPEAPNPVALDKIG
jgi:hypothetical protein